jgi:hypothetical protein
MVRVLVTAAAILLIGGAIALFAGASADGVALARLAIATGIGFAAVAVDRSRTPNARLAPNGPVKSNEPGSPKRETGLA